MASVRRQFGEGLGAVVLLVVSQSLGVAGLVQAQVLPDGTLPMGERSRLTPNVLIDGQISDRIDGGSTQGNALFHSLLDFNVNADQRLFFANPSGIEAIFSRVTGSNASEIQGTLGVQGGADLYLLNPNGILFGPNARLDIGGSFFASTADSLTLGSDFQWGIASTAQPALLNVGVEPGLQWGNLGNNSIVSQGSLSAGKDFQLVAHGLDLQGQLQAGQDLTLRATDEALLSDSSASPFIARAGGDLVVQGDRSLQLSMLNHRDSGLFAGGNLTFRSAAPIQGDARYSSGDSLRFEGLDGGLSDVWSPNDPVIRSQGDVSFNSYTGTSLHILAGGSVEIPGAVTITGPGTAGTALQETVTLSDQETQVAIDGSQFPTLDVRAGLANVETIGITGGSNGFNPAPQIGGSSSTEGNIRIGSIAIAAPEGLVFLSTHPADSSVAPARVGTIEVSNIQTGGVQFQGNAGSVVIDALGDLSITERINASSQLGNGGDVTLLSQGSLSSGNISASSVGNLQAVALVSVLRFIRIEDETRERDTISQVAAENIAFQGNGGNIRLTSVEEININDIDSIGLQGGSIYLQSDAPLSINNTSILNAATSDQAEKSILVNAPSLDLSQSGIILALQLGSGKGADVEVDVPQNISIASEAEGSILTDPIFISQVSAVDEDINQLLRPLSLDIDEILENNSTAEILENPLINLLLQVPEVAEQLDGFPISDIFRIIIPPGSYIATSALLEDGVAGDIDITTKELAIRSDAADIDPNLLPERRFLSFFSDTPFAGLSSATLFASVGSAGQIDVTAESIDISGNQPGLFSPEPNEALGLSQEQVRTISSLSTLFTGITSAGAFDPSPDGSSGNISVKTDRLSIRDGAGISASARGGGAPTAQKARVDIEASDQIELQGKAFITSVTNGRERAADVNITVAEQGQGIFLREGAFIQADTLVIVDDPSRQAGPAGDISLQTPKLQLTNNAFIGALSGNQGGAAGNLTIEVEQLEVSNSLISAATLEGDAGQLAVQARDVLVEDGAALTVSSAGQGQGGDLNIQAHRLSLDNQGRLAATTASGEGGNINLDIAELLTLRRNSQIETDAQGGSGNGGDITIANRDGFILGLPEEDSDITANAIAGRGGNIDITTQGIFGLEFRPERTPQSDITASSEVGVNGNVTIDQLSPDPAQGLDELPANFVDGSRLIAQNLCRDGRGSEFIVTGRGGLPKAPGDAFEADLFWEDWRTSQVAVEQSDNPVDTTQLKREAPVKVEAEAIAMVEAQGWSQDATGAVSLVLEQPETYRMDWRQAANCRSMKPLAQTPPPSPGPLPPNLGEGEFESPSPKLGRGI